MEDNILKSIISAFSLISPFLAAFLTYYFGIKKKTVDEDFDKKKELNVILADLLDIWYYLQRLRSVVELNKENDLPIPLPSSMISTFILQSETLSEECFTNFEESVKTIKKYDAIIYYELVGIGKNLDYMRKTFILPFIHSKSSMSIENKIADYMSNHVLGGLEESILKIAKKLGKSTLKKAKLKIEKLKSIDSKEMKLEFLQEYHEYLRTVLPFSENEKEQFTVANMVDMLEQPEMQKILKTQFEVMKEHKLEDLLNLVSINPNLSLDELSIELEKLKLERDKK